MTTKRLSMILWLFLPICHFTGGTAFELASERETGGRLDERNGRRIQPAFDYDSWKPIDYGNPMLDDPTLYYMPPVVEHIHHVGASQRKDLVWPIQPKNPPVLVTTTTESNRRLNPVYVPKYEDRLPSILPKAPRPLSSQYKNWPVEKPSSRQDEWPYPFYRPTEYKSSHHHHPVHRNKNPPTVFTTSPQWFPAKSVPSPSWSGYFAKLPFHSSHSLTSASERMDQNPWDEQAQPRVMDQHRAFHSAGPLSDPSNRNSVRNAQPSVLNRNINYKPIQPQFKFPGLVIQGHSKVRMYGSHPSSAQDESSSKWNDSRNAT